MNCPVFLTLIRLSRIMCRAFSGQFTPFVFDVLYTGKTQPTDCRIFATDDVIIKGMIFQFVRCKE
jgi:hypothetical protein